MTNSTPRPRRRGARVTLREVAEAAGVSTATVSHVLNETSGARIGPDTRQRVRDAADALGYRPNAAAKNLVTGTTRFIGLVADAIATTPFAGQIIHGAQDAAWRQGYTLLVANTAGNTEAERDAIAMMLDHQVQGILYSTWYHRAVELPAALRETNTILVNCYAPGSDLPAVVPDEVQGGRTATQALLDAGHRRIAFVNTTTPSPAHDGRLRGYGEALRAAGITVDPALVFDARPEQEGGYDVLPRVLEQGVTAVFCHNDRVAMGLYDAVRERGLTVPEDLSVMGFDNQEIIAAHLRPPLSTVGLPHGELGAAGVRLLLGQQDVPPGGRLEVTCPQVLRASVRNLGAAG
ncbi:LacI family DNA-binding transcriptional regulator [Myceligenerans indicum]|uniref:Substrate-binding domain-containing protein n=1 Tax=Myceligenerans indicum TaxID=2593663 RepID=A0ABS1LSQ7_9MICO|nr:LacI family DNA-binding transcriptional regulator [Myceligenerans indicum]MBL0888843.1 substrate-binding domain-containing protein [Myceligenerans indicum]